MVIFLSHPLPLSHFTCLTSLPACLLHCCSLLGCLCSFLYGLLASSLPVLHLDSMGAPVSPASPARFSCLPGSLPYLTATCLHTCLPVSATACSLLPTCLPACHYSCLLRLSHGVCCLCRCFRFVACLPAWKHFSLSLFSLTSLSYLYTCSLLGLCWEEEFLGAARSLYMVLLCFCLPACTAAITAHCYACILTTLGVERLPAWRTLLPPAITTATATCHLLLPLHRRYTCTHCLHARTAAPRYTASALLPPHCRSARDRTAAPPACVLLSHSPLWNFLLPASTASAFSALCLPAYSPLLSSPSHGGLSGAYLPLPACLLHLSACLHSHHSAASAGADLCPAFITTCLGRLCCTWCLHGVCLTLLCMLPASLSSASGRSSCLLGLPALLCLPCLPA